MRKVLRTLSKSNWLLEGDEVRFCLLAAVYETPTILVYSSETATPTFPETGASEVLSVGPEDGMGMPSENRQSARALLFQLLQILGVFLLYSGPF